MRKLCIGFLALFIILLSAAFFSLKNVSALAPVWGATQTNYRWGTSGSITPFTKAHNTSGTIVMWSQNAPSTAQYLQFSQFNISGSVSQSQQGNYFNGDFTIQLALSSSDSYGVIGGFNCDWFARVELRPEQGTVVSQQASIKSCTVTGSTQDSMVKLSISSSGKLSQVTTVSSYVLIIGSTRGSNNPVFSSEVAVGAEYILSCIAADVNFSVTTDSTTQGLGNIEQGVNQVNNNLEQQKAQDQKDRDNVQSASDSGEDNANASQEENEKATSSLLSIISSFIQALGAPASNCKVRTDLGNLDLGTLDFCTGKPAELTPIINTVCAIVMCIPIYLIAKDLFRRFVYITTFAQGGEYK